MLKIKNLITLTALFTVFTIYCAQERKEDYASACSQMQSLDISDNEPFKIISKDGKVFKIPYEVAMQSNLIKVMHQSDPEEIEIPIPINSDILYRLLIAMRVIYQKKNHKELPLNAKQLYEEIQQSLFKSFNLKQLVAIFYAAIELDFAILENVFADRLAQLITDENIDQISYLIRPEHHYLIEKFYYLRSQNIMPEFKNLLIYSNRNLQNLLNINPINFKHIAEEMIQKWKLSVNDFVDYKSIKLSKFANSTGENDLLNLNYCYITSLDGLQRIQDLNNLKTLYLRSNLLTTLGNSLNGLNNLNYLVLDGNPMDDEGKELVRQIQERNDKELELMMN